MKRFSVATLGALICAGTTFADSGVRASLVSEASAVARGAAVRVGVQFAVPDQAHIYWHNPGDSGLPTSIEWTLPPGATLGDLKWPIPEAFYDDFLKETTFGYEGRPLLYATLRLPYALKPGDTVTVSAKATWLVCLESGQCIPGTDELRLTLPVEADTRPSPTADRFDEAAARTPGTLHQSGLPAKVSVSGQPDPTVRAILDTPWRVTPAGATFYPDRGGAWRHAPDEAGEHNDHEIAFTPLGEVDGYTSGALRLPVENAETGEARTAYIRFGARPSED